MGQPSARDFLWTNPLAASKLKCVIQKREKSSAILWVEAFGFSSLILLSWLTEVIRLPHIAFAEAFTPDWRRAMLRSGVILLVWAWVHLATKRLLKRLHYLEEFLRICGWCRKVCHDGDWLPMEKYFSSKFATRTSHGMCPECLEREKRELQSRETPPAVSGH